MEKERGKRLFSTLSQRCLIRTCAHIQSHGSDSYLLVIEFKAAQVRPLARNQSLLFIKINSHSLLSVTNLLCYSTGSLYVLSQIPFPNPFSLPSPIQTFPSTFLLVLTLTFPSINIKLQYYLLFSSHLLLCRE